MQPPPDDGPGTVESPPEGDPNAFDPGVETGYLRRAPREGPPDVELGAHPFDPGEDVGFDDRRARKRRRQREREEKERAEAKEIEHREADGERELAEDAERQEAEREARLEAEEAERHQAELARLEAAERELEEAERRAVAEAERARRESERQDQAEREARARATAERAEREAAELRRRDQRKRERAEAKERRRRAAEEKARARKTKAAAPPRQPRSPATTEPVARRRVRRPARPMPAPGAQGPSRTGEPPSLRRPTAKLGAAAIAIVAGAMLLGSAAGLPTPFSGSEGGVAALNAQGVPVGSGIAAALYRGPFHPVRGDYDYGEQGAEFGADRGGRRHEGQDIFSKRGTPLVAIRDGIVVDRAKENSTYSGGRGNYVAIYSPIENRSFVYLHLLEPPPVEKGDRVHAGQLVGLMGCTGSCYGTHLHFEVRRGRATFAADTKAINPVPYLDDLPQAPDELAEP